MYLAADIETTGLDPETCQTLEMAFVLDDQSLPVMKCPYFLRLIRHDKIVGEPFALAMNAHLLKRIAEGEGTPPKYAMEHLSRWLLAHLRISRNKWLADGPHKHFILLGKNVGSFDLQFLKRLDGWPKLMFKHRSCDVGSIYSTATEFPSQRGLLHLAEEYNITGNPHEALFDARVSLALARRKWGINH